MKKILITSIILMLIISLSPISFSDTIGEFIVGNSPPTITIFQVRDGETSWDDFALNTHDTKPDFKWTINDANPDLLSSGICIGTTSGACDILASIEVVSGAGDGEVNYEYTGTGISFDQALDCNAIDCSKTYYVSIYVQDAEETTTEIYAVEFINQVPLIPFGLTDGDTTPLETHIQLPTISWTATDADDGTIDRWPADTLTYPIIVGTSFGDNSYLDDPAGASSTATLTTEIPWAAPGAADARTPVYARINTTDSEGISSTNYEQIFELVDYLPTFVDIYLSDIAIDKLTDSCTTFLPQNCDVNPRKGQKTSVNILLEIDDIDDDCDTEAAANLVLCLVDAAGAELCDPLNNADYVYELTYLSKTGTTCEFTASIPAGDQTAKGIEFFKAPGVYKLYTNASSQAGISITKWNYEWEYISLPAPDYPATVALGSTPITLGSWNPGTNKYIMTNYGNLILNINWEATDPKLDTATCTETLPDCCSGHTNDCWDLTTSDDFQVDDDDSQSEELVVDLSPVNIPETPVKAIFEPSGGLQICTNFDCNTLLGETLDTHFHIKPPLDLSPGTYKTTIKITTT